MSANTKIEWADHTFNPWIGCTKVSPACDHCYAEADFDKRRHVVQWGTGQPRKRTSIANWLTPARWNAAAARDLKAWDQFKSVNGLDDADLIERGMVKPARPRVFCASLADVADKEVPIEWLADLLRVWMLTPNLDWLALTKRIGHFPARLAQALAYLSSLPRAAEDPLIPWLSNWISGKPPSNVWLGATICNQAEADRDIPKLLAVPAARRFLSMEPLLGHVNLHLTDEQPCTMCVSWNCELHGKPKDPPCLRRVDWIIVGGESGPSARPMHPDWARSLRDQCQAANVPFLFKQHGEWLATTFCNDDMAMIPSKRTVYVRPDGSFHDGAENVDFFGGDEETAWVGKKAAGRLLDGREWNEVPASAGGTPP